MVKVINPFNKSDEECYTVANAGCACGGTYNKTADRLLAKTFGCSCSCNGDDNARGRNKTQGKNS